ncbi:triple tyrosine motif-containing protein [Pseudohaliea rubra]|uniref:Histidine kinase domain-containing protein n=1 Tax=Pseudohaliea rubra DSM 19751 TaxID=1265313 RepID=A0A095VTI3_9GAMM|nr:triple tyrosine motif-containing protein [Pseudohaliea rubra]KGE04767.1 hypothetical protein HRUBRA_00645 [Pseudohaliea rubra DSM 19751]
MLTIIVSVGLFSFPKLTTAASTDPGNFLNVTPLALAETSGTTFTDIVVRADRDVWAASLSSVIRYDGHSVQRYSLPRMGSDGFPVARIADLFLGPYEKVWVAGFNGSIYRFNPNHARFQLIASLSTEHAALSAVKHDGQTSLWLGYADGSCKVYDIAMGHIRSVCDRLNTPVRDFSFSSSSTLILSEDGRLLRLPNQAIGPSVPIQYSCEGEPGRFSKLEILDETSVLIGSEGNGLFRCNLSQPRSSLKTVPLGSGNTGRATIHELLISHSTDTVVVATDSSLVILDARSLNILYNSRNASDLVSTEFTGIAMQNADTIWASSFAGLHRLQVSPTVVVRELPATSSPAIVGFASVDENTTVIADYAGLLLLNKKNTEDINEHSIARICEASGGITAVAVRGDSIIYGLRSGEVLQGTIMSGSTECEPIVLASGVGPVSAVTIVDNEIFIGTYGNGVYRLRDSGSLEKLTPPEASNPIQKRIVQIEPVGSFGVLLLTEGGLIAIPESQSSKESLSKLTRLLEGTTPWAASTLGDLLWLATPTDGVYVVSLKDFPLREPTILAHQEVPGEIIQAVEATSDTEALIATTTGVFNVSTTGGISRVYAGSGNALVRFDFGASHSNSSSVLFGGTGGFVYIDPDRIQVAVKTPAHGITSYAIDEKRFLLFRPLTEFDRVVIEPENRRLTFNIGSLAPLIVKDLELRYKLKGFDATWSQGTTRNEISYTSLPPGSYQFQSQAKDSSGKWSSATVSLTVQVLPPWWRSLWALTGYLLAAIGLVALIKHYYGTILLSRRATQLAREMTATANQAIEDMQEEVEAQGRLLENVTRKNVATLSWISELVGRQADTLPDALSAELAKVSLERIDAFVCLEYALRYRDDRVLADLHSFTDECIAMLCARRGCSSRFTLINEVSDELIDAEHAARVATVIFELLVNAIDHAFEGREHGNFLRVAFELAPLDDSTALRAVVTVEDNGIGLPEGLALEDYATAGFSLVREVVAHYGGSIERPASSAGTSWRVELPLPREPVAE